MFPDKRLFSDDINERAQQRDMERICDVRLAQHLGIWVHVYKSPLGLPPDKARAEFLEERMQPAFDYLDALLADGRSFICGAAPTPADCTLQAGLNFMRFTGENLIADREHLTRWDTAYRARPLVAEIIGA